MGIRPTIQRLLRYSLAEGLGPFLVRAVAGSGVLQVAGMLVTFAVGVLLARGLGVEGYGYFGIAMAVIGLASIPGEFGLPKLVTREVAGASARDDLPRLLGVLRWSERTCYLMSAAAMLAVAIGTLVIVGPPSSPLSAAILFGVPIIPLAALAKVRAAALQGLQFVVLGLVPFVVARPLFFALALFALFHFVPNAGAPEAVAVNALAAAGSLVLAHLLLKSRLPERGGVAVVEEGRRWLASSIPMGLTDGMRTMQPQLIILLLGILSTPADVGLIRIALSTAAIAAMPIALVNAVTAPTFAKLFAEGDKSRLQQVCTRSAQAMVAAVALLSLPIFLWGSQLITIIFGAEFAPAFPALVVLLIGQIINAAFGANAILLAMGGLERRVTRATALALVGGIAAVIGLVPWLGMLGAAYASVLSLLIWNIVGWNDARKLVRIDTFVRLSM